MLQKPSYYDDAKLMEVGVGNRIPAGWYPAALLGVTQGQTQSGSQYLDFAFDIIDGEYTRYYAKDYNAQTPYDGVKKWRGNVRYFLSEKAIGMLKGAMKAVEESNPGYQWDWDETKIKGKKVGVGIREEEYEANDGSVKTTTRPFAMAAIQRVITGEMTEPKPKLLNKNGNGGNGGYIAGASGQGYTSPNLKPPGYQTPGPVPTQTAAPKWEDLSSDEELPF
jgi:hypothetical protein